MCACQSLEEMPWAVCGWVCASLRGTRYEVSRNEKVREYPDAFFFFFLASIADVAFACILYGAACATVLTHAALYCYTVILLCCYAVCMVQGVYTVLDTRY